MDDLGAEVGQKMRSAIKAKLVELGCYVDDELPDYIMVMVANKRGETLMKEDLKLFLSTKTDMFVDWLQIVLKKLKEVTVTNPDVYKRVTKRRTDENISSEVKVKKERKDTNKEIPVTKCLTDDLPIEAIKLSKNRKIILKDRCSSLDLNEDVFDIPPLSAVSTSNENELIEIENKIASVKSRLGIQLLSESEDDGLLVNQINKNDCFPNENENVKAVDQDIKGSPSLNSPEINQNITVSFSQNDDMKAKYTRIVFENSEKESSSKKSIYQRLGKKKVEIDVNSFDNKKKIQNNKENDKQSEKKRKTSSDENKKKDSALKRLGVRIESKVFIPEKQSTDKRKHEKQNDVIKNVKSCIKVKPRVVSSSGVQPNKNLLLKAVAEAQRSIAQTPIVGTHSNFEEKDNSSSDDEKQEYVPKPIKRCRYVEEKEYIPTHKDTNIKIQKSFDNGHQPQMKTTANHRFVITLDGIEKNKCKEILTFQKSTSESTIMKRKSPIVFENAICEIPETSPIIYQSPIVKTKEKCKFWPSCTKGEKCEYYHPNSTCKNFPQCKFGDKCLYFHPPCKFESSCTKKDCPYSHIPKNYISGSVVLMQQQQQCKFFPNCINPHCPFYHPKPCRFGKFCKNKTECNFLHTTSEIYLKPALSWRN